MTPMNRAPLANVIAYLDHIPSRLARVKSALQGRFEAVWSPRVACVMATRALPLSAPDGKDLRAAGLAFAEGRDSLRVGLLNSPNLELLPGNVGFARAEEDRLVVVRSGPGTVPWYAWQDRERALVATSFTELVRLLPVAPELDPLVCGIWASLNGTFPDGRTFLRGVMTIPPGHTAEVRPGRQVRSRLWWNPWPEELAWPSRSARADHVRRFGEAVLAGLEREVAVEPVNLLTLSGGVDSSALAYLAGRHLARPLAALSFVPPVGAADADREREASYLDPVVADLGIRPHVRKTLGYADRFALAGGTPPVAFPVLHPALQALPALVHEHRFEVLFGGEYADEICGGWPALPDWLDAVPLPRLVLGMRSLPRGRSDVIAWARRRIPGHPARGPWPAGLRQWVRPEIDEEYRAWGSEQERRLRASSAPHRHHRAVLSYLEGVLAMNWEVCSSLGVRRAFPFLTAEVLEVISACHPSELVGPGSKRLERAAFAELVPERHLLRPDKDHWHEEEGEIAPGALGAVPAPLATVLRDEVEPPKALQATAVRVMSRFASQLATVQRTRPI